MCGRLNSIDAVRRELATRYVADRNRSLAEVSALLGFSSPSGFSRWSRREFAATPSKLRSSKAQRAMSGMRKDKPVTPASDLFAERGVTTGCG